jgi:hypothetical protein
LKTPHGTKKSSRVRKVITSAIIALVALASFYGAIYLLIPYSGFARALVWMDADIKDYEKFPARAMNNAPPIFNFQTVDAATQEEYLRVLDRIASQLSQNSTVSQAPFNDLLASTQTTAFLIIKDDRLIYETISTATKEILSTLPFQSPSPLSPPWSA